MFRHRFLAPIALLLLLLLLLAPGCAKDPEPSVPCDMPLPAATTRPTTGAATTRSAAAPSTDLSSAAPVAGAAADVSDQFNIPDGYELRVWAQSPQLFNPTNIDVDARGRIWAAEAVNYRETIKRQNALKHPDGDRVVILQDTDGDGACDSSKVFVQDKDLVAPLGVAVLGDNVVVSCSPHVIVYTDRDGDDVPDDKKIFLTGFGGFDHDHGVHAVTGHLDGRWYFNVGNAGPHDVRDARGQAGWRLNSGSFYDDRGTKNTGNRTSDDGRVWTGGIALRIDADGKHLTPLAHNFRNCYEVALDSFGNLWQTDNDDDGNQSCRVAWLLEGGDYGYGSADGTRSWRNDRRPGQETPVAHWHQEDPGVLPAGDITGAGGPTGCVVYEGGLLPEKYRGALLNCDAGRNVVRVHAPVASGAGYRFDASVLVESKRKDGKLDAAAARFRPSDVAIGTDGAVYIADWYDPVVGGHDIKDKRGGGRILRLAPRGDRTPPPKVDLQSLDGQLAALNSPAVNIRYAAANALVARGAESVAALKKLSQADGLQRTRAMWVLSRFGGAVADEAVASGLRDKDADVRIAAFRAFRATGGDVMSHAATLAKDVSPAVRREVAVALRDVPFENCRDVLVTLAERLDPADRFALEAFGIACDGKAEQIYPVLLERLGSSDVMHAITWRLHPPAAIDPLASRAAQADLPYAARRDAANALAFIRDPRAAEAMERLAQHGPEDLKPLATWWLVNRAGNEWKDFPAARRSATPAATQSIAARERRERDTETMTNRSRRMSQREEAALRLAADAEGGKTLISLAAEQKIPDDVKPAIARAIYRNPDLGVRAMAGQYFPRQTAAGEALPPIVELAKLKGDPARGKAVFFGATSACSRCHAFNGDGKDVGPDLSQIRTKFAKPELLDAILNPSGSIAFAYTPWIVQTVDNQVYSGFIIADGASVVVKESTGEQRTIPAAQVKKRIKQSMSVMPDNVGLGMTAQELADVAEFLLTAPVKR